jgi:nicotinamide phosphoribosyltransferase
MNPLFLTDGYKTGHHQQYPKGTTLVYSNFTPRSNKYAPKGCDGVVVFGTQMVMQQIHEAFQNEFFDRPKDQVCGEMKLELSMYLNTDYDVSHFEALHDLGYLPIVVKSLPEGTVAPIKVPVLTIYNTHPDFYWVTNYLETILSNLLWKPMTSATIAHQYRKVLTKWQEKTDAERDWFIDWQGHDFSMRGMDSVDAVISSGLGHLTSFYGSDSLPAIHGARKYYREIGMVCGSVNATEHSVMCAGGKEDEVETFRRLLETYPTGILSVVSDTWDLWKVCTEHVVTLKEEIMARDGKLVIRPDSGDPVDILCGKLGPSWTLMNRKPEDIGVIELLWNVFGGTINEQGYKVLDPHIGAIYGDSITIERADEICRRLEAKGFASTNVVLGIGSFTYQYNTRDTFGFAMKATYVEVNGEGREIFKDPVTDDGTKKSATGLLRVRRVDGELILEDRQADWDLEHLGELKIVYMNGKFSNVSTLTEIRDRLKRSAKLQDLVNVSNPA